MNSIQLEVSI